jgi:cytochrome P450 family 4
MGYIMFMKVFDLIKSIKFLYQFTSTYKHEKDLIKRLHDFTDSVISVRRKYLRQREFTTDDNERSKEGSADDDFGMKKKTAFLDLLLQVKVEGEPLSDESIREEVDTFMFEARMAVSFCAGTFYDFSSLTGS